MNPQIIFNIFVNNEILPAIIKKVLNNNKVTVTALMADKDMAKWRKILIKAVFICLGKERKKLLMFQVAPLHDIGYHVAFFQTDGAFFETIDNGRIMRDHDNGRMFYFIDFSSKSMISADICGSKFPVGSSAISTFG